ncbi:internal virion protein A [Caudoviricetes sp.]|nr:internal virion protein A [Caudoviricetes sp.]
MGKITIRMSQEADILPIARFMREQDQIELKRSHGTKPYVSLKRSKRMSVLCWTMCEDDFPIAMFGASPMGLLSNQAFIWFLGTDRVKANAKSFMKLTPIYVNRMLQSWPYLTNTVDPENTFAVRYLKRVGFTFKEKTVKTPKGYDFLEFYKERK